MKKEDNTEWINRRKELMETIINFGKGDRLQIITQTIFIHNALSESIMGWGDWLNHWMGMELTKKIKLLPKSKDFNILNDKDLWKLFEKYRDITLQYINLDIEFTNFVNKKLTKKVRTMYEKETKEKMGRMVV